MKIRFLASRSASPALPMARFTRRHPTSPSRPANATPDGHRARLPRKKQTALVPLGQEIPMLDPSAETITVGGVAIPLGDNRLLKARFEKYLSQPPESDEAAAKYRETIAAKSSPPFPPSAAGGPDLYSAFKLLPTAAAYPGDANLCGSLAESIYTAMLAKKDVNGLSKLNLTMEQEKKKIISEGDWAARHEKDPGVEAATPEIKDKGWEGEKPRATKSSGAGVNSLKYAETLRRIAEIEALKKANIVRTEAQTLRTKAQYQVSMVQWFVQRRYEHVLMAARFYNQIWKDGDATLRVDKNSDVSKLFSESVGVSPTVALAGFAFERSDPRGRRNTSKPSISCCSRGELHSASQRLMEAYALGEYPRAGGDAFPGEKATRRGLLP